MKITMYTYVTYARHMYLDHYWRTAVRANYGDTTPLKSVLRQTRSAQLQCHLPPPAWRSPQ